MGTHFLKASMLREGLQDLEKRVSYMQQLLGLNIAARAELVAEYACQGYYTTFEDELHRTAAAMQEGIVDLLSFLSSLSCEPLIYTGDGDADAVIAMLEDALDAANADT